MFVNKVLLEHNHGHFLKYYLCHLGTTVAKLSNCNKTVCLALKDKNVYCLAFYRKCFVGPCHKSFHSVMNIMWSGLYLPLVGYLMPAVLLFLIN